MDLGTAWRAPGCDDRGWESGPAQLDFGDGDEATVVRQSPDGAVPISAAYFRHALVLTNAGAVLSLTTRLTYDAGAVVYLNGVEVGRANIPDG